MATYGTGKNVHNFQEIISKFDTVTCQLSIFQNGLEFKSEILALSILLNIKMP